MSNLQIDLRQLYATFTSARQPYIRWPAKRVYILLRPTLFLADKMLKVGFYF
jgi:hypothetical protein